MKTKHFVVAALYLICGVPLVLIVWAKAASLLNARSNLSVLSGVALIAFTVLFISLSGYLLWRSFFEEKAESSTYLSNSRLNGRPVEEITPPMAKASAAEGGNKTASEKGRYHDKHQNQ